MKQFCLVTKLMSLFCVLSSCTLFSVVLGDLNDENKDEKSSADVDNSGGGLATFLPILILSLAGLFMLVCFYTLICHRLQNRDHRMLTASILGQTIPALIYALAEAAKGSLTLAEVSVPTIFDGLATLLSSFLGFVSVYFTIRSLSPYIPSLPRVSLQQASRHILGFSPAGSQLPRSQDVEGFLNVDGNQDMGGSQDMEGNQDVDGFQSIDGSQDMI